MVPLEFIKTSGSLYHLRWPGVTSSGLFIDLYSPASLFLRIFGWYQSLDLADALSLSFKYVSCSSAIQPCSPVFWHRLRPFYHKLAKQGLLERFWHTSSVFEVFSSEALLKYSDIFWWFWCFLQQFEFSKLWTIFGLSSCADQRFGVVSVLALLRVSAFHF